MRLRHLYLVLAVLGLVLPYAFFIPFLRNHGPDVAELMTQLFANHAGGFFGVDVFVSAVVLLLFIAVEGRRLQLRRLWLPVLGTLAVGVSFGLPLFLFLRQQRIETGSLGARRGCGTGERGYSEPL